MPVSYTHLSIAFVPSREPEEIITATEPLKEMLTAELAGLSLIHISPTIF